MSYSGTMISDLEAAVERAEFPILFKDPLLVLADAKVYLADRVMEVGDADAWWEINEAMDRLQEPTQGEEMIRTGLDNWLESRGNV